MSCPYPDTLTIRGLKIQTIIGTLPWERQIKQTIVLDLKIEIDIRKTGDSDNLENALDYANVCQRVSQFVKNSSFQLIETLADQTAQFLLQEFPIGALTLEVKKPGVIREADGVSVLIERKK